MRDSNPHKRRRLNNNLATSDRLHVMVGIEKRKNTKLEEALDDALKAKDAALAEIGKLKSEQIATLEANKKQSDALQQRLQSLYHELQHSQQSESALTHKTEILDSQLKCLHEDNAKLAAQLESNCKLAARQPETGSLSSAEQLKRVQLEKQLGLAQVKLCAQQTRVARLEAERERVDGANGETMASLGEATRHIERLQAEMRRHTAEHMSARVESGL